MLRHERENSDDSRLLLTAMRLLYTHALRHFETGEKYENVVIAERVERLEIALEEAYEY